MSSHEGSGNGIDGETRVVRPGDLLIDGHRQWREIGGEQII